MSSSSQEFRIVKVVEVYRSEYPEPVCFETGDLVVVGPKDDEYPDWVWVKTSDNEGWAPEQYLEIHPCQAIALQDYTARELDTRMGEPLKLHFEESQWGWCENARGETGWIPMKTTEVIQ